MTPLMIVLLVLTMGFDFLNGVHDSSNIVATVISSRALPPRVALTIIIIAEFLGPLIFGVAVATTIGNSIVTQGLVTSGFITAFKVPLWVILLCSSMIAFGISGGGWKLIKTLGAKFYKIRPIDGFSTQISSAIVILSAALFGGLVSTTQIVSASIMGVGSAERVNKVHWEVAKEILLT